MWEQKSENGIWSEYVNSDTGESSIKTHQPKEVKRFCKQENHYFEVTNPNSRQLKCRNCDFGTYYILGIQQLVDGKVVNTH